MERTCIEFGLCYGYYTIGSRRRIEFGLCHCYHTNGQDMIHVFKSPSAVAGRFANPSAVGLTRRHACNRSSAVTSFAKPLPAGRKQQHGCRRLSGYTSRRINVPVAVSAQAKPGRLRGCNTRRSFAVRELVARGSRRWFYDGSRGRYDNMHWQMYHVGCLRGLKEIAEDLLPRLGQLPVHISMKYAIGNKYNQETQATTDGLTADTL